MSRQCSKTGCSGPAVATLTYVYRDSTAVLGPLATYAEPHTYDLCSGTPSGSPPRAVGGRQAGRRVCDAAAHTDDLLALANAVREAGRPRPVATPEAGTGAVVVGRRGHLRILRDS